METAHKPNGDQSLRGRGERGGIGVAGGSLLSVLLGRRRLAFGVILHFRFLAFWLTLVVVLVLRKKEEILATFPTTEELP